MRRRLAIVVAATLLTACSVSIGSGASGPPSSSRPVSPSVERKDALGALCESAPRVVLVAMGGPRPDDDAVSFAVRELDGVASMMRAAGADDEATVTTSMRDAIAAKLGRGVAVRVFFIDQLGRKAVGELYAHMDAVPGVVAVEHLTQYDSYVRWLQLSEGVRWAQDVPRRTFPEQVVAEFERGTQGLGSVIADALEARGVRDVTRGDVTADVAAIESFRAMVVEACPGIVLWPGPEPRGESVNR